MRCLSPMTLTLHDSAKNQGFILDSMLKCNMSALYRNAAFFHMRNTAKLQLFFSPNDMTNVSRTPVTGLDLEVVHLIISHLYLFIYWTSTLHNLFSDFTCFVDVTISITVQHFGFCIDCIGSYLLLWNLFGLILFWFYTHNVWLLLGRGCIFFRF